MRTLLFLLLPILMAFGAPLEDADQEQRARALMNEIRCVACENEPISQSNADIAEDMRDRVREMIGAGASDAEVRAWFADRYGEFVLFRPSAKGASGMILWGIPFGLLLIGAISLALAQQRKGAAADIDAVPADAFDLQTEAEPSAPPESTEMSDHVPAHDSDTQS